MQVLRIDELPEAPLDAAAMFYGEWLPSLQGRGTTEGGGRARASTQEGEVARSDVRSTRTSLSPTSWVPSPEGEDVLLVFRPADHTHRAWRLAAVQELAREAAPLRVNALASDDEAAIASALACLAAAPGLTGQYLPLDGTGAGAVVRSDA